MKNLVKSINEITARECPFEIITVFQYETRIMKEDNLYNKKNDFFFLKHNKYLYIHKNIIKIYNSIFNEIATFEMPFTPKDFEIIEDNSILLLNNNILYYFKFNIKENKSDFVFYTTYVYTFKYLKHRKEILIIMTYVFDMVKIDLKGKVIYYKYNLPRVYFEVNKYDLNGKIFWEENNKLNGENYNLICGFNKDKYIMILKSDNNNKYNIISIYNSENLNLLYNKNTIDFLRIKQITDKYFSMVISESSILNAKKYCLLYYDEKKNNIKFKEKFFIPNIFSESYYLNDHKFAVLIEPNIIYLINLYKDNDDKKIVLKNRYKKFGDVQLINIDIKYYKRNKYLFITTKTFEKINNKIKYKIIKAIIKD